MVCVVCLWIDHLLFTLFTELEQESVALIEPLVMVLMDISIPKIPSSSRIFNCTYTLQVVAYRYLGYIAVALYIFSHS